MIENYINKVICSDYLKVLEDVQDKSIDLILTSPPFLDKEVPYEYYSWLECFLNIAKEKSKNILMFNSSQRLIEICKRFNPITVLVWNKKFTMSAFRYEPIFLFCNLDQKIWGRGRIWSTCISCVPPRKKQTINENPIEVYVQLLKYFPDCKIVCDPFVGSGTTCIAAKQLGRDYIGIDINPECCKITEKRLNFHNETVFQSETKGEK